MSDKFESLNLKKELIANLKELNFTAMTPIQAKSLPHVLDKKDVLAQAKTGSGKTAAFGLGLLNSIDISNTRPQALVLCPTRELAEQVAKEIRTLARMLKNIKILTLTGGSPEYHQGKSLNHGAHIVVGTPGRVLKLIRKEILVLSGADTLVLDEADRMIDMGFHDDIEAIAEAIPRNRQTLLFSATFPDEITQLGKDLQRDAIVVKVDTGHEKSTITETFYELDSHKLKMKALLKIIDHYRPDRFIVFCKTKVITDQVSDFLHNNNVYAEAIHGDLEQRDRTAFLTMFSNRSLSALVATDVAARGLDIHDLEAVINFDLPTDPEVYTHRIGRTARAGNTGLAISLFVKQEMQSLAAISKYQNEECNIGQLSEIPEAKEYDLVPPMTTIFIAGGKKDKLRPGDIVGALIGEANLSKDDIGDINILIVQSYVAIKSEHVDHAVSKLNEGRIKNRKFKVGLL